MKFGCKRKKKRSAMQMAKKFARRRENTGQLDSDNYQYILRILEVIRDEFDTVENKEQFVTNIYEQTQGKELDFVKNQVISIIFQVLKYELTNNCCIGWFQGF